MAFLALLVYVYQGRKCNRYRQKRKRKFSRDHFFFLAFVIAVLYGLHVQQTSLGLYIFFRAPPQLKNPPPTRDGRRAAAAVKGGSSNVSWGQQRWKRGPEAVARMEKGGGEKRGAEGRAHFRKPISLRRWEAREAKGTHERREEEEDTALAPGREGGRDGSGGRRWTRVGQLGCVYVPSEGLGFGRMEGRKGREGAGEESGFAHTLCMQGT